MAAVLSGLLYFLIAIAATLVGSLTGMGGGVIIKPVLDIASSLGTENVSMLSSITVFIMTVVAVAGLMRSRTRVDMGIAVPLAIGSVLGGNLGSALMSHMAKGQGSGRVTVVQNAVLAAMIVLVILYMRKKDALPSPHLKGIAFSALSGLFLGFLSSFLGIGGGPINVAMLVFLFAMDTKTAAVCSLITILFSQASKLATTALTTGFSGYELGPLPMMVVGGVCGGILGAKLHKRISNETADKLFNAVQVVVLCLCIVNIVRGLTV